MIIFQVFIKFWFSERNTENTMLHLDLNEGSDHSEENTCKNEVINILTPQLQIYYIQYQNRKSPLVQMPEATIRGIMWKKVFFKISQNLQEALVPEKTPVNLATFSIISFLQNSFGRLLLKCGHCKNKAIENRLSLL